MFKRVIGICGLHGAGNDTVRQMLEQKLPAIGAVTSDCVREATTAKGLSLERDNLYRVANEGRVQQGEGVWARRAWEKVQAQQDQYPYALIGGIRSPAEVHTLKQLTHNQFTLIAVTAPLEVRYQRVVARRREGEDQITLEAFRAKEERELAGGPGKQNITDTLALADYKIENDGTPEQLEQKVDQLVQLIQQLSK